MKYSILLYSSLLISFTAAAHPGIGIVKDSKGNIYYTDLKQVWKIGTDGNKTAVVYHVHTHELYMDANDDLYGEHLWYNGDQSDSWAHYAWCLRHTGKLDTVIKPTEGFLADYSFVRDGTGNMYWVQRFTTSRFKMKTARGEVKIIGEGKFRNIRWLYATKNGILYFVDLTDLYKLEHGRFTLLAKNLHERGSVFEYGSPDHNVYGMWTDKAENIYVAVMGGKLVKQITPGGKVNNVVYSPGNWSPCGGLSDEQGNMWLLEADTFNNVRVRKIPAGELARPLSEFSHFMNRDRPALIITAILAVTGLFLFRLKRRTFTRALQA